MNSSQPSKRLVLGPEAKEVTADPWKKAYESQAEERRLFPFSVNRDLAIDERIK